MTEKPTIDTQEGGPPAIRIVVDKDRGITMTVENLPPDPVVLYGLLKVAESMVPHVVQSMQSKKPRIAVPSGGDVGRFSRSVS